MKRNPVKTKLNKQKKWWKDTVRSNWSNKCAKCGKTNCKLDTHHLYYGKLKWTEPRIGLLLCSSCHKLSNDSAHKGGLLFYQWFFENYKELVDNINTIIKDTL